MSQIHKRFTSDQVKELFDRYSKNEIERKYIQEILGIKKTRFFMVLKQYKEDPRLFTIQYQRTSAPRTISPMIEQTILKELSIEKKIIQNKEIPLKSYNYSYIRDRFKRKISSEGLPTHDHRSGQKTWLLSEETQEEPP